MTRWGMAAAIVLGTAVASAAGPDISKPYKAAVKLEVSGDIVGALQAFENIPVDRRDFNTRLHIAGCKKKLGRLLAAEADYEAIRTDPKADQPTIDTAGSDLEDLRTRIPVVKIRHAGAGAGVITLLDDREVSVPSTTKVDPGEHLVHARRGAATVFERKLRVDEGSTIEVVIEVPGDTAKPAVPAVAPPAPAEQPAKPPAPSASKTVAWVLAGATVALVGTGTYFAIKASEFRDERDDLASRGDAGAFDAADRARSAQMWGRISVLGAIGTAAGSGYFFWSSQNQQKPHVAVGVGAIGGFAFNVSGSW